MRFFSLGLLAGFAGLALSHATAFADPQTPLEPGQGRCEVPTASDGTSELQGTCYYRAKNQAEVLNRLILIAQEMRKRIVNGAPTDYNAIEPKAFGQDMIKWWFPKMSDNESLLQVLKDHDQAPDVTLQPSVDIEATMYALKRGYRRDFGVEVGLFYGNRSLDAKPGNLVSSIADGIFSVATGIGNPLASFINLGITASRDKNFVQEVSKAVYKCNLFRRCEYSDTVTNHFVIPGGLTSDKKNVGLVIDVTPRVNPAKPTLVDMGQLSVSYSVPVTQVSDLRGATGPSGSSTSSPTISTVSTFELPQQDWTFETNKLFVLGGKSTQRDARNGELLGSGSGNDFDEFLVLMRVAYRPGSGDQVTGLDNFTFVEDDRSFTNAEKAALPDGKLTARDILGSVKLVCFKDHMDPVNSEKICGFQLTKMDRRYVDDRPGDSQARLRFKIKGPLKYGEQKEKVAKFGDVFEGKGYFPIPLLTRGGNYEVSIELDDSNDITRAERHEEGFGGIKFDLGYFPGDSQPYVFSAKRIEWLKEKKKWFHR